MAAALVLPAAMMIAIQGNSMTSDDRALSLTCRAETGAATAVSEPLLTDLCGRLRSVLEKRGATIADGSAQIAVTLEMRQLTDHALEGQLIWRRASGADHAGGVRRMDVMDTSASAAMHEEFLNNLIEDAALPI